MLGVTSVVAVFGAIGAAIIAAALPAWSPRTMRFKWTSSSTASLGGRTVITLRYRNLSTGELEFLDHVVAPAHDAHVWLSNQECAGAGLGWLDAHRRRKTQTWRVIFGVNHRPFIVERIQAGAGIVPGEPPPALMALVVGGARPLDPEWRLRTRFG